MTFKLTLTRSHWVGLFCVALAVLEAALSPAPVDARVMPVGSQPEAFRWLSEQEPALRDKAITDFVADRWSQDDAFAAFELERVEHFSREHSVRRQDVFNAFQKGMREGWSLPAGVERPRSFVAPCRPRPIY